MASFVYAVWSITNVASMHCGVRPEISPCTCEPNFKNYIELSCEKVDSFLQIVNALSNRFASNVSISLIISHSQLEDLEMRSFSDMNLNLKKLRMISNNLRSVPELPFRGLSNVEYLSLAENNLEQIPKHVLNHLPKIATLDLGKGRIRAVNHDDLKGIPNVKFLILVTNNITRIDKEAFPPTLLSLHLGRNQIHSLNGSLQNLLDLETLFINSNNITTLENELPPKAQNLKMILAENNSLEVLPQSMKEYPNLQNLFFQNNKLKSLDHIFKYAKKLVTIKASQNQIEYLAEDEFENAELLEELCLELNNIKSLNKSLLPLKQLQLANFSGNQIEEFSMFEIYGLYALKLLDLSNNRIQRLVGLMENAIEPNSYLVELRLQNNQLRSLDGALSGLNKLRILILSNNKIERILPNDFVSLESLEILDLSHNQLVSLAETSTTFLPSLKILKASYNNLTKLEKDFHGLPVLCQAYLSNNQIMSISTELVAKTNCNTHGVLGKLEIWLENNPIMCDENVRKLCPLMEEQQAKIRGKSQCLDPDSEDEVCTEKPQPIIVKAPLPLIPQIIQTQLQNVGSPAIASQPPVVHVIVPAPLVAPKSIIKAELATSTPMTTSSSTMTTTSTTTNSTTTTITPSVSTETSVSSSTLETLNTSSWTLVIHELSPTTSATPLQSSTTQSNLPSSSTVPTPISSPLPLPIFQKNISSDILTEYSTVEYSPIIETDSSSTSSEADDNSVSQQFSPIVLPEANSSPLLVIPDEPPENP